MRLGFPRALMYYDYYPFWAGFFYKLGIQLVLSPATNREIMNRGLKLAPDDTCLPIKILVGHLTALKDVDGIFLPRLISMEEKTYLCPKVLGIPESVLFAIPPEIKVYTVDINWRAGKRKALQSLMAFGAQIGCSKSQIRESFVEAQRWMRAYQRMRNASWSFEESMERFQALMEPGKFDSLGFSQIKEPPKTESLNEERDYRPKIALVGHSYLTYEAYANLNLLHKLKEKAEVYLVENVPSPAIEKEQDKLRKRIFWSHAKKEYGAGAAYIQDAEIDGLIYLSCFGCGTDSMTNDLLARRARKAEKPYLVLTIDEHTGEAGLVTRLEAFLDMLERKNSHEAHFSSYGQRLDSDSGLA